MAHFWSEADGRWLLTPLSHEAYVFDGEAWYGTATPDMPVRGVAALVLADLPPQPSWALIAPQEGVDVRVNGWRPPTGLRVLHDRDQIDIGSQTWFFSAEVLPVVQPFAGASAVSCPRCKTPVVPLESSVRCPGCRVVYHQSADRPCWTYGATCPLCGRATALDQPFTWTPEAL